MTPDNESMDFRDETLKPSCVFHSVAIGHNVVGDDEKGVLSAGNSDDGTLIGARNSGLEFFVQAQNMVSIRIHLLVPQSGHCLFDIASTQKLWVPVKIALPETVRDDGLW